MAQVNASKLLGSGELKKPGRTGEERGEGCGMVPALSGAAAAASASVCGAPSAELRLVGGDSSGDDSACGAGVWGAHVSDSSRGAVHQVQRWLPGLPGQLQVFVVQHRAGELNGKHGTCFKCQ